MDSGLTNDTNNSSSGEIAVGCISVAPTGTFYDSLNSTTATGYTSTMSSAGTLMDTFYNSPRNTIVGGHISYLNPITPFYTTDDSMGSNNAPKSHFGISFGGQWNNWSIDVKELQTSLIEMEQKIDWLSQMNNELLARIIKLENKD